MLLLFTTLDQKAESLMNDYLRNRQQVVKYDNSLSLPIKCVNGMPQGSVLDPLLFSVYIIVFIVSE